MTLPSIKLPRYSEVSASEINNKSKAVDHKKRRSYSVTTNRTRFVRNMKTNLIVKIPQNVTLQIKIEAVALLSPVLTATRAFLIHEER